MKRKIMSSNKICFFFLNHNFLIMCINAPLHTLNVVDKFFSFLMSMIENLNHCRQNIPYIVHLLQSNRQWSLVY